MKKVYLVLILLIVTVVQISFSQSRKDIEKEREPYKNNKVKTEIINYESGSKSITKFDVEGKRTETLGYYNNQESNIVKYSYDSKGNMIEEAYLGYESGDHVITLFYYDEIGNVVRTKDGGLLPEYEHTADKYEFSYDEQGKLSDTKYLFYNGSGYDTKVSNYQNIYENGNLISQEPKCSQDEESVELTYYFYDKYNVTTEVIYSKNCKSGNLKQSSKKIFSYYNDGLLKEVINEASYLEGNWKALYSYEYYRN